MSRQSSPTARKPGRPPSGFAPDSRQALIDAAKELFAAHDFKQVSTKRIAEAAGVNAAMIQYHFKGKSGLLEAAFRETIAPVVAELTALSVSGGSDRLQLRQVISLYMQTMAANPWLPKMILRYVLPEGGQLQALMAGTISAQVVPAIAKLVADGQKNKELRADLDPTLTTISLVSLALFPFLSLALTQRVFDWQFSDPFVADLIEHTATIFSTGAEADGHAS